MTHYLLCIGTTLTDADDVRAWARRAIGRRSARVTSANDSGGCIVWCRERHVWRLARRMRRDACCTEVLTHQLGRQA